MSRLRIQKDLEKSLTPGSMITTDALNEAQYIAPGANGQYLSVVAGTPTWSTLSFPSEYEQAATPAALPGTGATDVIYYTTSDNSFRIWNGSAYVAVPTSPTFTVAGNSGTNQAITSGDILSILATRGFTVVGSATDTMTVTPPAGTVDGQLMTWNNTTSVWEAVAPTASTFTLAGAAGTNQTISGGDTLTIKGATNSGILTTGVATDTIDISLREQTDLFTPANAATTVTATQTPIASTLQVYRNGLLRDLTTDYTLAGSVVTLIVPVAASSGSALSETIKLVYRY
jgi:hypothetical protein